MKKKSYKKAFTTLAGILIIFSKFQLTYAQTSQLMESFPLKTLIAKGQEKQPLDIGTYIVRFINFLSLTIGSFALLAIIIAGVMMVASGGREHPLTRGKDIFKFAIIGLVVALGAYFITAFVQSIFYDV